MHEIQAIKHSRLDDLQAIVTGSFIFSLGIILLKILGC